MTKILRFFFDPGSGTCLWSGSAAARAAYGYPVDHHALPLQDATKRKLDELIALRDTDCDWNDPAGPGAWSEAERSAFNDSAQAMAQRLQAELPAPEFSIHNESGL